MADILLLMQIIRTVLIGKALDEKTQEFHVMQRHRLCIGDTKLQKLLLVFLKFKMYPVIRKGMLRYTAVILRHSFWVKKKAVRRHKHILSVKRKNGIRFQQKQKPIPASLRTINEKIGIMSMIKAYIVKNHADLPP